LVRTLELIDPPVVATLGSVALDGIKVIEPHSLSLKENAGKLVDWSGRKLIPLYHPSPQVIAAQRGFDLQLQHFQTLAKLLRMKLNGS
jgi:DNA polymerase